MAFDLGSVGGMMVGWFGILIWLALGFLFVFGLIFGALLIRRNRKLYLTALEITNVGGGKVGIKTLKAGWFKSNWFLGLIDYGGETKLLTKDKREIQNASSEDFHTINGKSGLIVQRKGDDPKVLLPINKMELDEESRKLLNSIAPGDYRDASVKLIEQAQRETLSKFAQYLPYIAFGVVFIIGVIVIIFTIQYVKHSQAQAWGYTMEAIKGAGGKASDVIQSTAPLILALPKKLLWWRK